MTRLGSIGRTLLIGLPAIVGGIAAIVLGAYDYVPWLMSPALWLGVAGSAAVSAWLVRSGRATLGQVARALVLSGFAFAIGVLGVFAGVVVYWVVL